MATPTLNAMSDLNMTMTEQVILRLAVSVSRQGAPMRQYCSYLDDAT